MASVFLSYDRDDLAKARSIAHTLETAGHSVWWDRHIKGGAEFAKEIEQALKAADSVVVLWSEQSVESAWVRDEAATGRDSGRLVPVRIDATEPPLGFRQYQTIDLPRGRMSSTAREALLGAVEAVVGGESRQSVNGKGPKRAFLHAFLARIAVGLALIVAIGSLLMWRPWADQNNELVLAVRPSGTDAASQALARDLTIRLGSLQTASPGAIRLIDAGEKAQQADLAFEAATAYDAPAKASLVLKSAKDSSILWSRDFEQPSGRRADLLQQLAYTAARITGCAREGLNGETSLKPATLKIYLGACAQLAEMATADPQPPIPMLLEVIEASPRFEPAWSKLLLAEAQMIDPNTPGSQLGTPLISELREHVAKARKVNPAMPAAAIAEAQLLPLREFARRANLIEEAAANSPDNPLVLSYLAGIHSDTGRLREAVDAAARAAQLDPLSPSIHSSFTALLAYAGNFNAATRELAKAEKLWPGTDSLWDAQYRFHLRYGDPAIARAIFERQTNTGGGKGPRLLLQTRENPTPANVERFMSYIQERLQNMSDPSAGLGFATLAFGQFGKKEEIISIMLTWPKVEDVTLISGVLFRPEFREVRRDPRFLRIAHRAGLLDYWRTSGNWPDFCYDSGKTYDCKTEAAKLK